LHHQKDAKHVSVQRTAVGAEAGVAARVRANVADSAAARNASKFEIHFAREAQAFSPYGGIDDWALVTLRKGDVVVGGWPAQTKFYTVPETIANTGQSGLTFNRALQIRPHDFFGYRDGVQFFRVTRDVRVPYSR